MWTLLQGILSSTGLGQFWGLSRLWDTTGFVHSVYLKPGLFNPLEFNAQVLPQDDCFIRIWPPAIVAQQQWPWIELQQRFAWCGMKNTLGNVSVLQKSSPFQSCCFLEQVCQSLLIDLIA